ncbi:hypothetical protein SLG_33430 [Sphingobium sp. SYK-6]|uniref:DUF1801 domain-containing protein n=1 Tax=Sphingobium sp. (strain NBRC 103272 / SYK-6) TaxID=627192 RepID=UPI0002276FD9|nr:DUF1801 domain-containing protein [Sphingobium sp. SYK-6]BAK68018.1 hypothetical protein SLG_33430 [Sphingobium sp. SYK-6]
MAELKTKTTGQDPAAFLAALDNPARREDGLRLLDLMARISDEPAAMWGPSIIGFGRYHYRYDSGHEGKMCRIGFSPRKANLVLYVLAGSADAQPLLARLGKHRTGKACLYINRLDDVDMAVLEQIVRAGWAEMAARHPA